MVVILLAPYLAQHVLAAPQLAGPLAIGAGLVFFGALNEAQTGALAGFEAFQTIARVNIYAGLASFPLIVLGVWRWGLKGAIWGSVAAQAISWPLNRGALRKECAKAGVTYQFAHCHRERSVLHRFSLPAFLGSLAVVLGVWVCNALLARQPQGYAELGVYAAADKWRVVIVFVPTYVFAMVVPVLSNLHGEGDRAAFQKVFKANLRLNGSLALVAAVYMLRFAISIHPYRPIVPLLKQLLFQTQQIFQLHTHHLLLDKVLSIGSPGQLFFVCWQRKWRR